MYVKSFTRTQTTLYLAAEVMFPTVWNQTTYAPLIYLMAGSTYGVGTGIHRTCRLFACGIQLNLLLSVYKWRQVSPNGNICRFFSIAFVIPLGLLGSHIDTGPVSLSPCNEDLDFLISCIAYNKFRVLFIRAINTDPVSIHDPANYSILSVRTYGWSHCSARLSRLDTRADNQSRNMTRWRLQGLRLVWAGLECVE